MSRHARSKDLINSKLRDSEAYYRRRVEHDAVFRCTHGIDCGGGCSLSAHVKNGLITWESPEPLPDSSTERGCEPRGCQRGLSASSYVYGPGRIKHPYVRGTLLDLWSEAQKKHDDPVEAWASLVGDDTIRRRWQKARGRGGFRRVKWDAAVEIIAASTIYTIQQYGPDRIAGYSSSPAPSMVGYAAGSRFLQLLGGVCLSHSDWESTAAPALSETWGEQNECHEAADWRNAKLLVIMADNLAASRPADFAVVNEARQSGSRVWYLGPEFNTTAKHSDEWVQLDREGLAAWWLAVNHVLLKDLQSATETAESSDYLRRFTDAPFLVTLNQDDSQCYKPGQLLRASDLEGYAQQENSAWKFLIWDANSSRPKVPKGSIGFRWDERPGLWDLELEDALDKTEIRPSLSFFEDHDEIIQLQLDFLEPGETVIRKIPVRRIKTTDGKETRVATVFDLLMSQYGVPRVPDGVRIDNGQSVEPFSPAWAEKHTLAKPETVVRFAREWAQTARLSGGKCLVIAGKESSQEFHSNLTYRAAIHSMMLCGCVGVNGGGLSHCAGQRRVSPADSWSCIAFAQDWVSAGRFQNSTSWFHAHSGQHDGKKDGHERNKTAFADRLFEAVKQGWIGFYPQFGENPFSLASRLDIAASKIEGAHKAITDALSANKITWAVDNTGAPANWPRIFFLWRSNALYSGASGHEYLLKNLLGTESNVEPRRLETSEQTQIPQEASPGKLDLLVDLSFRMDTSALYSDIVLPATTWYEKEDINSTEAHNFIQPISRVIDPCWEAKSEWQAFKLIAEKVAALSAKHLPEEVTDVVTTPLTCNTADEISLDPLFQANGASDEGCRIRVNLITRDYRHLAHQFLSLGPLAAENGLRARGFSLAIDDLYTKVNSTGPSVSWSAGTFPSLSEDKQVCDLILLLSSATNGNLAQQLWEKLESRVGRPLVDLSEELHNAGFSYEDLLAAPRRTVKSPLGSDAVSQAGTYTPFADNIELGIPWRTLTGRQHFFIDHPVYLSEGEHLPAFRPDPRLGDRAAVETEMGEAGIMLRFFPLQSRWSFDSMFGDSTMIRSLSRDLGYLWLSVSDAEDLDLTDDGWAEVSNRHGAVVARVTVSTRVNKGTCHCYIPDRTLAVPKSPSRGYRRAGGHSSLDRIRAKPSLLAGGYGQICYGFDYLGPVNSKGGQFVVVSKVAEPSW